MRKEFVVIVSLFVALLALPVTAQNLATRDAQESITDGNCAELSLKYWASSIPESNVAEFQNAMDHYFMYNGSTCPSGVWNNYGWGEAPMSKLISYSLAIRGYELSDQLNHSQKNQLYEILRNELREDTLIIDDECRLSGNSCSKDYMSFTAFLASAGLFPEIGGDSDLEEKYFNQGFAIAEGSLVWENRQWDIDACEDTYNGCPTPVKMYVNGIESPVSAGELFVELGNALFPYKLTGKKLPSFYYDNTVLIQNFWYWMRSKTDRNGIFSKTCHDMSGNALYCGSGAPPPAGRVMTFLFGVHFVWGHPNYYDFISVSSEDTFIKYFWDVYNPSPTYIH